MAAASSRPVRAMMMPSRPRKRSVSTEPGLIHVDLHAVALAEVGQRLHEGELRADHRRADHVVGDRGAAADAADGDDRAAAGLEQRPRRAAEPDLGEELQREARLPVGVGQLEEIAAPGGAGVVDQDVEPAEALLRRGSRAAPARPRRADRRHEFRPGGRAREPRLATPSSAARSRAVSNRSQPAAASSSAMPRPMPRLAPVTSATLP